MRAARLWLTLGTVSAVTGELPIFPFSNFVNHGYGALDADVLGVAGRADPAWRTQPLFAADGPDNYKAGLTYNGQYRVPDTVEVSRVEQCSYKTHQYDILRDTKQWQQHLMRSIDISLADSPTLLKYLGSGSVTFSEVAKAVAELDVVFITAESRCSTFLLTHYAGAGRALAPGFAAALSALPRLSAPNSSAAFLDFVETFGTHYPQQVTLGSTVRVFALVAAANFTAMVRAGVDLSLAAEGHLFKFLHVPFSTQSGINVKIEQAMVKFFASVALNRTVCRPRCPHPSPDASDSDASGWQRQLDVFNTSAAIAPVAAQLISIPALLRTLPAQTAGVAQLSAARLQEAAGDLETFMNDPSHYCAMRKAAGGTHVCTDQYRQLEWTQAQDMLQERRAAVAAAAAPGSPNTVYLAGGSDNNGEALAAVHAVDLSAPSPQWIVKPGLPSPRMRAAGAVLTAGPAPGLYVVGGTPADGPTNVPPQAAPNSSLRYDFATSQWFNSSLPPEKLQAHAVVAVANDTLLSAGGGVEQLTWCTNDEGINVMCLLPHNRTYFFSGSGWGYAADLGTARMDACAAAVPGGAVIVGGTGDNGRLVSAEFFNLATRKWSPLPDMPEERPGTSCAFIGGLFHVFGGYKGDSSTLVLNLTSRLWRTVRTPMLRPTGSAAVAVVGGGTVAVVCGGSNRTSGDSATAAVALLGQSGAVAALQGGSSLSAKPPPKLLRRPPARLRGASAQRRAAAALSTTAGAAASFKGIAAVGQGVDMFAANPDALAEDPGLRRQIFDFDCTSCYSQNRSVQQIWRVPDAVSVRLEDQCSYNSQYSEIHSSFDWLQHIDFYVKKRTHVLFFHHTDTHEFHQVEELTAQGDHVVTKAKGVCLAYTARINLGETATLRKRISPGFAAAVASLPTSYDPTNAALINFVRLFGTHHIAGTSMGGSAVETSVFDRKSWAAMKRESSNVDPGKYGSMLSFFEKFGLGLWVSQSHNINAYKSFNTTRKSSTLTYIPNLPPAAPNGSTSSGRWLEQVRENPAVVAYDASNITDLLVPALFPNDSAVAQKAAVLRRFIDSGDFCTALGRCAAAAAQPRWEMQPPMPAPRASSPARLVGRVVYFVGGAEQGMLPNTHSGLHYNVDTQEWGYVPAGASGIPTVGAATAAVPGSGIFMIGGKSTQSDDCHTKVWSYTPNPSGTGLWSQQGALPAGVCAASAVAANDGSGPTVFVMGGIGAGGATVGDVLQFSAGRMWAKRQDMPTPRAMMAAVLYGSGAYTSQEIYTFGGSDATGADSSAVEVYNVSHGTWTKLDDLPPVIGGRSGASAAVIGGVIVLVGGNNAQGMLPDVWAFDPRPASRSWQQLPSLVSLSTLGSAVPVPRLDGSGTDLHYFGGLAAGPDGNPAPTTAHSLLLAEAIPAQPPARLRFKRRPPPPPQRATQPPAAPLRRVADPAAPQTAILPGVEHLSYGYNILRGNPLASAAAGVRDGGWVSPVFEVACPTCFAQRRSLAGLWSVPDAVTASWLQGCTFDSASFVLGGEAALQASLGAYVDAGATNPWWTTFLLDARFSGSASFSAGLKVAGGATGRAVGSIAKCVTGRVAADHAGFAPKLSAAFEAAVRALPNNLSDAALPLWAAFVEEFGTHIPREVVVGGHATLWQTMTEAWFNENLHAGADLHAVGKVGILFDLFGAKITAGGSISVDQYFHVRTGTERLSMRCHPSCPQPALNISVAQAQAAWADHVVSQAGTGRAVPVATKLRPITDAVAIAAALGSAGNGTVALLQEFLGKHYCKIAGGCSKPVDPPQWSPLPPVPGGRIAAAAGVAGGSLVVAGGSKEFQNPEPVSTVSVYDAAARRWDAAAPLDSPRSHAASCSAWGKLYVAGGLSDCCTANATVVSVDASGRVAYAAPLPDARYAMPAVWDEAAGKMYLIGGARGSDGSGGADAAFANVVSLSDPDGQWSNHTGQMPGGGLHSVAAALLPGGKQIVVFGGYSVTANAPVATVQIYDIAFDRFTELQTQLPYPRYGASALPAPGGVLVVGGQWLQQLDPSTQKLAPTKDVLFFNATTQRLSTAAQLPAARSHLALVAHPQLGSAAAVGGSGPCAPEDFHARLAGTPDCPTGAAWVLGAAAN
eukprot:TRINITY_DN49943_c0_g1_i1.p1 TRINITY_DN49943_c0_g1~~TRINITY_DN49943_c0_g1_i1.p1  ORF type:complete len:2150 (+),score=590.40 TRINITY_DN49943_c0_g1_i1:116-6451(+)